MFSKTLQRFRALPQQTRAMVFLHWVYTFVNTISGVFISILVFVETQSVVALIQYAMIIWLGVGIGFCAWGYFVAQRQLSMRLNYMKAFAMYTASFIFLFFFHETTTHFNIFALIHGTALGMFWLGVHTFEMLFAKNRDRDFYSSMISASKPIFGIAGPLIATLTFVISEYVLAVETYTLLLWILPFAYLLSFPFLFSLPDYTPPKISRTHMKELFHGKRFNSVRLFNVISGLDAAGGVVKPLVAITALGSVINVGFLETLAGILAIGSVVAFAHRRRVGNRVKMLWVTTAGMLLTFSVMFFYDVHWLFYVIATFLSTIFIPLQRVSMHVIDLHVIDRMRDSSASFYEGLLFRDFLLFLTRIGMLSALLIIALAVNETTFAKTGIIFWAGSLVIYAFAARSIMKKNSDKEKNSL